jgi:hypothetical protein
MTSTETARQFAGLSFGAEPSRDGEKRGRRIVQSRGQLVLVPGAAQELGALSQFVSYAQAGGRSFFQGIKINGRRPASSSWFSDCAVMSVEGSALRFRRSLSAAAHTSRHGDAICLHVLVEEHVPVGKLLGDMGGGTWPQSFLVRRSGAPPASDLKACRDRVHS